jgi:hypothetical protein
MMAPQPQRMGSSRARSIASGPSSAAVPVSETVGLPATTALQQPQAMMASPMLKLHSAQQLILAGDISGTIDQGKKEADRRVSALQSRVDSMSIDDWREALHELSEANSKEKIKENTYLQLCNAAQRQHRKG